MLARGGLFQQPAAAHGRRRAASRRPGRAGRLRAQAAARDEGEGVKSAARRQRLLGFVRDVEPAALVEEFLVKESPVAVGALRQTITNMLGTITATPQFFSVTITASAEHLAMLMSTVCLTGYMLKAAEERYRLQLALTGAGSALSSSSSGSGSDSDGAGGLSRSPSSGSDSSGGSSSSGGLSSSGGGGARRGAGGLVALGSLWDEAVYAPGAQKSRVAGDVLLWHRDNGVEAVPAARYMELLEGEVTRLRAVLAEASAGAPAPPRLPPAAAWGADAGVPAEGGGADGAGGEQRTLPALRRQQALAVRPHEERNELLNFVRGLDPAAASELTAAAPPEAAAAMDVFVERLMGVGGGADRGALRRAAAETHAHELRQLLFWLMVVGWRLRGMESAQELEGAAQ